MNIRYYRGDDHEVRFRFKNFTSNMDNVFFIVKDSNGSIKIEKTLNNGIRREGNWYYVGLKPDDTNGIIDTRNMTYDIKIIIDGSIYTANRGNFRIE